MIKIFKYYINIYKLAPIVEFINIKTLPFIDPFGDLL